VLKPTGTDAEKASYAQLLAKVCADVVAAQAHTLEHFKGGGTH
jgi:hypothetical protein